MTSHAFKALQKNTIISKFSNRIKWRCSRFEREFEARNRSHKPPTILPAEKERPCRDIRLLHNFVSSASDSRLSKMEHLQGLLALLRITNDVISPATKEEIHQAVDKLLLSIQKKRPLCEILDSESDQPPPLKRLKLVSPSTTSLDKEEVLEEQIVVHPTSGDESESKKPDELGLAVLSDKPKISYLKKKLSKLVTDRSNSPLHGETRGIKFNVLPPKAKDDTTSDKPKTHGLLKKKRSKPSTSRKNSLLHGDGRETKLGVLFTKAKSDTQYSKKSEDLGRTERTKKTSIVELKKKLPEPSTGHKTSPLIKGIKQKGNSESDVWKIADLQREHDSILKQAKKAFKSKRRQLPVKTSTVSVTLNNSMCTPEDLRNRILKTRARKETEQSDTIRATKECIINAKEDSLLVSDRADTTEQKPESRRIVLLKNLNVVSPVADSTLDKDTHFPIDIALGYIKPSRSEDELRNKLFSKMMANRSEIKQTFPLGTSIEQLNEADKNSESYPSAMAVYSENTPASDMLVAELLQMVESDTKAKTLAAKKRKLNENHIITMTAPKLESKDVEPTRKVLADINNASMCNVENTANIGILRTNDKKHGITDNANNNSNNNDKLRSDKDDVRIIDSNEIDRQTKRAKLDRGIDWFASKDKYVVCITGDGIVKKADTGKYSMTKLMISQDELKPRRLRRRTKIVKTVRHRQVDEQLYKHVLKKVARDTAESNGLECCAAKCWRYNVKLTRRLARK